jgi:hypothetical protein
VLQLLGLFRRIAISANPTPPPMLIGHQRSQRATQLCPPSHNIPPEMLRYR